MNYCLYSWNTLTSLSKLLVALDFDEYIGEMATRTLDWRNPLGKETFECFRYIYTLEKNMLESARDNGGFSNNQPSQPLISTVANPAKENPREFLPLLMHLILNLMRSKHTLLIVTLIGSSLVQDISFHV